VREMWTEISPLWIPGNSDVLWLCGTLFSLGSNTYEGSNSEYYLVNTGSLYRRLLQWLLRLVVLWIHRLPQVDCRLVGDSFSLCQTLSLLSSSLALPNHILLSSPLLAVAGRQPDCGLLSTVHSGRSAR
jgi:hypothetical protein